MNQRHTSPKASNPSASIASVSCRAALRCSALLSMLTTGCVADVLIVRLPE